MEPPLPVPDLPPDPKPVAKWGQFPWWAKVSVLIALGLGIYWITQYGLDGGVRREAQAACETASQGIVLTAALVLSNTIENADDPQAMAQAIREECPAIVAQILEVGNSLDS